MSTVFFEPFFVFNEFHAARDVRAQNNLILIRMTNEKPIKLQQMTVAQKEERKQILFTFLIFIACIL